MRVFYSVPPTAYVTSVTVNRDATGVVRKARENLRRGTLAHAEVVCIHRLDSQVGDAYHCASRSDETEWWRYRTTAWSWP